MSMPTATILPAYVSAALAASHVGTWRCSIDGETIQGDAACAAIFGLGASDLRHGVAFADMLKAIHPDDRKLFSRKADAVRVRGGHIALELRVRPVPGTERWVLMRGRYEAGDGSVGNGGTACVGFGIVVDVTNAKRVSGSMEPIYLVSSDPDVEEEVTPIQTLASMALSMHHQATAMEPPSETLRAATELLLLVLGRKLAQEVDPRDLGL